MTLSSFMNKKVSIIVLNYNGLEFLKKCLSSIDKQTHPQIEVVVTDNNSTDGSVEYIKGLDKVILVANKENYGYAKANNLAAQKATGEFLFFLNNDTELDEDTIEKMLLCYQENSVVTPAQIQLISGKELVRTGAGMDIFGYPYVNDDPRKTRVFYADGAGIFVKKKDFLKIGGFDEELFIFQEDIDFSWRAQMLGYKVIPCWEAKFRHYGGGTVLGGGPKSQRYQSSYFRRYLNEKNVIRNILKNYSFPLCLVILLILLMLHGTEIVLLAVLLKWKVVACYLKAYKWNILNLRNTLEFRKKVQEKRVVSDINLMKRMYWSYSKLYALVKLGLPQFKE